MRPWVKALNSSVASIKHLAERRGVVIDEAAMAEKMGMTEAEFRACLSGESKVPQKLMSELIPAYAYLIREVERADRLRQFKENIALVYRMAEKDGVEITDEEIGRRIGVTPDRWSGYMDGSIDVPERISDVFYEAFKPDLFRTVGHVTLHGVHTATGHLDLPPEDEL